MAVGLVYRVGRHGVLPGPFVYGPTLEQFSVFQDMRQGFPYGTGTLCDRSKKEA